MIGSDSTTVNLKAEFTKDISESPKGTLSVSAARVRPGAPVDFTVDLAPASSLEYWQLGYNVTGLQLWRRREGDIDFTFWKAMEQDASNHARYRWVPEEADAGKYEIAAFVNTQLGVPWLEVAPNSVREVEVSCFAAAAHGAPPQAGGRPGPAAGDGVRRHLGRHLDLRRQDAGTADRQHHGGGDGQFVVDPSQSVGRTIVYKASGGSFTLAINHPGELHRRALAEHLPDRLRSDDPARLIIFDDGFNPQSYGIGGAQLVNTTSTVSCPGKNDVVSALRGFLVNYAYGTGPSRRGRPPCPEASTMRRPRRPGTSAGLDAPRGAAPQRCRARRGSKRSRRPSPSRLRPNTVSAIATPG